MFREDADRNEFGLIAYRRFEYLAATDDENTTAIPGDQSFTSALIFALTALVEEKEDSRFTTQELLAKIKEKAPRFPKDQVPVLSPRMKGDPSAGRIMLHPLNEAGSENPSPPRPPLSPGVGGWTITLCMDFARKPSTEDIEKLHVQMANMLEYHNFGVLDVRWAGMKPDAFAHSIQKFTRKLKRIRRASDTRQQVEMEGDLRSNCRISKEGTELLTPLDTNMPSPASESSPQMHEFIA